MSAAAHQASKSAVRRFLQFNAVGLAGACLQVALLAAFIDGLAVDTRLATLLAVEAALLHNFALHERWTWRDRIAPGAGRRLSRLFRFHACNGAVSLLGNLVLIQLLVEDLGWPVAVSGAVAIAACALANFALGHRLVFKAGSH